MRLKILKFTTKNNVRSCLSINTTFYTQCKFRHFPNIFTQISIFSKLSTQKVSYFKLKEYISPKISKVLHMKYIIFTIISLFFFSLAAAQVTFQPRKLSNENRGIVYDKEFATEFRLQTNGWGFGATWGNLKTYYLTRYYYVGLGELKHTKEFRTSGNNLGTRSFIFGKQNSFYQIKAGIGEKRYFTEKASQKGVAVGVSYRVGPTLGFLKPYYLEISPIEIGSQFIGFQTRSIRYTDDTADDFLDKEKIIGYSGLTKGWENTSIVVGGNLMGALHLGFGAYDQFVKAIDVGVMLDFFLQPVPIMIEEARFDNLTNRPYFLNIFINFQIGKRQ